MLSMSNHIITYKLKKLVIIYYYFVLILIYMSFVLKCEKSRRTLQKDVWIYENDIPQMNPIILVKKNWVMFVILVVSQHLSLRVT